ncbi:hypothetical protein L6164_025684 [Bauhinia variegata]|uniref:Uncharacterized protein n=1 Tax=Bauhinia variegata TaxID=167791 RepID=A0ACB9M2R6_BAUVA|nr:hypothetical protein L6164_025684 [Bauhinia variegata]
MAPAVAFVELADALRSKQEKWTSEERNLIESCRHKAARNFFVGAIGANTVVWAATFKLDRIFRISSSIAAGAFFGLLGMNRALNSCVEHILTLDGSRLQKELAHILVTKFPDDPKTMQLIPKHFFSEKVFDDSNDHPKLRWRNRNFYSDNVVHGQNIGDHDSRDDSNSETNNYSQRKRTNLRSSHVVINPGHDTMAEADPLDFILGYSAPVEATHDPNTPTKPQGGVHNRAHRRAHRRRRIRHPEGLSNLDHAIPA